MFDRKDKRPEGPSFPFLENNDGDMRLRYDGMKVEQYDGRVSITFMQGNVPIYALTYTVRDSYRVDISGMSGEIKIALTP